MIVKRSAYTIISNTSALLVQSR